MRLNPIDANSFMSQDNIVKTEGYPLVSIITPSYNQGRFIEQTIVSVISQEGRFYLEYLVIDGGSADNSVEIIKKYEQVLRDERFPLKCAGIEYKWISEPDKGQSEALNKGFRMAKGELIGWLNSDDTYLPGTISRVINEFSTCAKVGLVYGDCNFVDEENKFIRKWETGPFSKKALSRYCPIAQPAAFFRGKLLRELGLLNSALDFAMDYEFWVRIFKKGYRARRINVALANYRLYPECKSFGAYKSVGEILWIVYRYFRNSFPETFADYLIGFSREKQCDLKAGCDCLVSEMLKCGKDELDPFLKKSILKGYLLAKLESFVLDFIKGKKGNFLNTIKILKEAQSFLMKIEIVNLFLKIILGKSYSFFKNRLKSVYR